MTTIACTQRQYCAACGSAALQEVVQLPRFPLTGIYVKPDDSRTYPVFDQTLLQCRECSHGQLLNTVPPRYLYQETYTHRSSASPIATRGNDFFYRFIRDLARDRHFHCVVELGCNDLYLLKKLVLHADHLYGFDPIWKDSVGPAQKTIHVVGKYLEEIVPRTDLPEPPDLVLAVHTLEHIDQPQHGLKPIFEAARNGALFVVEVPCLDSLLLSCRFDQVFHQHLNYFSLSSMFQMVQNLGGTYVAHCFNYGYWSGTLLFAFQKGSQQGQQCSVPTGNAAISEKDVSLSFDLFRTQLQSFASIVRHVQQCGPVRVLGYGAAQMLPALAYHLESDLGMLECILDDNRDRTGLMYPGLKPMIRLPDDCTDLHEVAVVVLALDSARPILRRVTELGVRYLLSPLHLC